MINSCVKMTYDVKLHNIELNSAIGKSHDSSPSPDDIHYQLIKHLSADSLQSLLEVFNLIWETGF